MQRLRRHVSPVVGEAGVAGRLGPRLGRRRVRGNREGLPRPLAQALQATTVRALGFPFRRLAAILEPVQLVGTAHTSWIARATTLRRECSRRLSGDTRPDHDRPFPAALDIVARFSATEESDRSNMLTISKPQRRRQIKAFLADEPRTVAKRIVTSNPWLCDQIGVDFSAWSKPVLQHHGWPTATLHMVGSAATGFSLRADQAGRRFRKIGGTQHPSDLDLGIVDDNLFDTCWDKMIQWERGINHYLSVHDRAHVYWGRIDRAKLPGRAYLRVTLRSLQNSVTRSREFRGYPASVRVYKHHDDMVGYIVNSIHALRRSVSI